MTRQATASCILRAPAKPARSACAWIVRAGRSAGRPVDALMDFGLRRMPEGATVRETPRLETAWVLLGGRARISLGGAEVAVSRDSLFDAGPFVLHAAAGEPFAVTAGRGGCEWAIVTTPNPRQRGARLYRPEDVAAEDRGAGLAQGACRRLVRTVFDHSTRPDSNLVIGEVVNFPGRWSTYPPHHHAQPEIYHYRFTLPQGYGHAEVGEDVYKVRNGDTCVIPGGLDHSQVSAPGYGMYYLWIIRHLPRRPYRGFTFTPAHQWLLDPQQQGWSPAGLSA